MLEMCLWHIFFGQRESYGLYCGCVLENIIMTTSMLIYVSFPLQALQYWLPPSVSKTITRNFLKQKCLLVEVAYFYLFILKQLCSTGNWNITHRALQMIQKYPQIGFNHWLKILQTVEDWLSHFFLKKKKKKSA